MPILYSLKVSANFISLHKLVAAMAKEKANHCSKCYINCITMCFTVFLLLLGFASAATVVSELPGFDGELPFYLETGYIGVGESNESQLFYYFVESQRNPALDPLMLWLTGGPGCSVLSAFFYENGPVAFDYGNYNGSLPQLHLSPYAWTKMHRWALDSLILQHRKITTLMTLNLQHRPLVSKKVVNRAPPVLK
ncbi:hypothetical protein LWI29_037499 [Acer saccharum]|nr:hypothetical protein LWI29_037499 [Acer saccharum]